MLRGGRAAKHWEARSTFSARRPAQGGTSPSTSFGVGSNHRAHRLRRRASPRHGRSSPPARWEVAPHPFAHAARFRVGRVPPDPSAAGAPATSPSTSFGVGSNHRTHRLRRRASPRRGRSSPPARPEVAPHLFAHADRFRVGRVPPDPSAAGAPCHEPARTFGAGPNHRTDRLRRRASPRRGRSSPPARPEVAPHLSHTPIAAGWDGSLRARRRRAPQPRARPRLLVWARTTGHTACAGGHPPDAVDPHRLRARRSRPTLSHTPFASGWDGVPPGRRRRAPPATSPSTSFGVGSNHRTHRL